MKNRKSVIGITGIVFLVLVVTMVNNYGNLVSSERVNQLNPYEDIISDINDSLAKVNSNNNRMQSIDSKLDAYRNSFQDTLDAYNSLGRDIKKRLDDVKRLEGEIDKTRTGSDELGMKLLELKERIEENRERLEKNDGIEIGIFYLAGFVLMNLIIWLQISSYYKNKYFEYRKY